MQLPLFDDLGDGIYCVDALYMQPGIACCYLLDGGGEWALIETGTARSVDNILATLAALGVRDEQVRQVIPTHVHLDHAGGAGCLMQRFPEARLRIHPRGARHMIDPARLTASSVKVYGEEAFRSLYGEILPIPESRVSILEDGVTVCVGDRRLQVVHTRGHAEHHLCLFDTQTRGWFSGDMFGVSYPDQRFHDGSFVMPATTPTQFDPALYEASVRRLAAENPQRFYLTHYGALPYEPAQADGLCRQIQAYARLGNDGPRDPEELEARILSIAEQELRRFTTAERAKAAAAKLTMDAKLNAQGIAWWRRSGASEGP